MTIRKLCTVHHEKVFYKSPEEIEKFTKFKEEKKQKERSKQQEEKVRRDKQLNNPLVKAWLKKEEKNADLIKTNQKLEKENKKIEKENKKRLLNGAIFIGVAYFLLAWVGTWGE